MKSRYLLIRDLLGTVKRATPGFYRLIKAARMQAAVILTSPVTLLLWFHKRLHSPAPYSRRILLVRLDGIGDYILFRNFIQSCKESRKFRGMKIDLLGNIRWKELSEVLDARCVDRFYWINPASQFARKGIQFRLNAQKYSFIIHPTCSRRPEHDSLVAAFGRQSQDRTSG